MGSFTFSSLQCPSDRRPAAVPRSGASARAVPRPPRHGSIRPPGSRRPQAGTDLRVDGQGTQAVRRLPVRRKPVRRQSENPRGQIANPDARKNQEPVVLHQPTEVLRPRPGAPADVRVARLRMPAGRPEADPAQIRCQSRKRAPRRGQAEILLRVAPIREFAKPARQRAARAVLLRDRPPRSHPDACAETPLYLFHDKPQCQNHRRKTGRSRT